jgi:hypothetical protein
MVAACGGDEVGTGSRGMAGASGEAGSAGTLVAATGGTMSAPPPMEDDYPFLCNGPGQSCTDSAECCNKNCVGGKCMAKQCVGPGTACMGDADCCDGGVCRGGTCAPADSMCRTDGSLCAAPADCCSTNCLEGKCAPTGAMAMCDMTFGPCDTFPACGCGDGETCHVVDFDTGTRACKPNGTAGAYQACTDTYGCAAGHVCVGDECKQYCQEDRHCPTTHPRCAPVGRSASESIPGFDVCWM